MTRRRRNGELERRLDEWAAEFGGSRYENIGWPNASPLAMMIDYHGRSPDGLGQQTRRQRTPADDVEEAVRALERQNGGFTPARIVCLEYTARSLPIEQKLIRMSRIGSRMNASRYYQHLYLARVHVAAWLRIPFEQEHENEPEPNAA